MLCFSGYAPDDPAELAGYIEFAGRVLRKTIFGMFMRGVICGLLPVAARTSIYRRWRLWHLEHLLSLQKTDWPEEAISNELNGYLVDVDDVAGLVAGVS